MAEQRARRLCRKETPLGVQYNLVDGALVLGVGPADRPGARDVAAVAVQLAPSIHQHQLPIPHPLHVTAAISHEGPPADPC